jgi:hypothetical protein
MMSHDESQRCPICRGKLLDLFRYLDVAARDCSHTLELTRGWCHDKCVDADSLFEYLRYYGGHCDCEIMFNVAPRHELGMPGYSERN